MQRFLNLRVGTSQLTRVVELYPLHNHSSSAGLNVNVLIFKRCLSNNENNVKSNSDPYKPSTTKEKIHVHDGLKGGQPTATLNDSGKVWSSQNPGSVHAATTNYVRTSNDNKQTIQATAAAASAFDTSSTANTKSQTTENSFDSKTNDKTNPERDIREDVLQESLKFVDEHGWTIDAIRAGIRASNQSSTIEGLFSNGYDLVEYFQRDANSKMSTYMKEQAKKGEIQGARLLLDGLKYRLGLIIPYANTWSQAMAQGALPQNAMRSWKNLFDLSSEAWHCIGDTSTNTNWYTKRLLLATVYKSAEIYMLQDQSQEKLDTMNFLERRLNDFQTLSSVRTTISKSLSDTAQITNGLFSVIRNLTSRR